ncbi:MAG: ORF6N domain-containing protein [Chitinophagaceae bacterium]
MTKAAIVPDEIVISKILLIRGKKVMIDKDMAELYGVTTKRLNEQVKRNKKRFPEDFMYQLTQEEKNEVVANCDHLKSLKYSPNLPNVFTEHGAVMLASVLNSDRAIEVNLQIVRIFTKLREMLLTHKDILLKLEQMEKQVIANSDDIQNIFVALRELLNPPQEPRPAIGFKLSAVRKKKK